MYKDKFVLSIIHDGYPVKEIRTWRKEGNVSFAEAAIPFDSEYKIRLKNKNNKGCTAKVFIDGKPVSKLGDLIISANGTIDLERFVDSSLDSGSKFKFVPLDHSDVDDPTSSENGIIKVEFRLAKNKDNIKINLDSIKFKPYDYNKWGTNNPFDQWGWTTGDFVTYNSDNTTSDGPTKVTFSSNVNFVSADNSNLEDGATIEGGNSNQSFVYSNLDVEDIPTILYLKIVGIKDSKEVGSFMYKYCSNCGRKVKRSDKFCSECGNRL